MFSELQSQKSLYSKYGESNVIWKVRVELDSVCKLLSNGQIPLDMKRVHIKS
jgi:hypothetical protein